MPDQLDFNYHDQGTIVLLQPLSEWGWDWAEAHLPDDCPRFGSAYAVEHRYAVDILNGITDDGGTVEND